MIHIAMKYILISCDTIDMPIHLFSLILAKPILTPNQQGESYITHVNLIAKKKKMVIGRL